MKLFVSVLGFLFLAAWLIEMWVAKHTRARRERDQERPRAAQWWKDPGGRDDLDGDY